ATRRVVHQVDDPPAARDREQPQLPVADAAALQGREHLLRVLGGRPPGRGHGSSLGRSAGGFGAPPSRGLTAPSFVVLFSIPPPVAKKNPFPEGPASMLSTGLESAVNRAFRSGSQSPLTGLTQPLENRALRTFVVDTLSRLKS